MRKLIEKMSSEVHKKSGMTDLEVERALRKNFRYKVARNKGRVYMTVPYQFFMSFESHQYNTCYIEDSVGRPITSFAFHSIDDMIEKTRRILCR